MAINLLGRKEYLDTLSAFYNKNQSGFTSVIGRRRVGKSQIILKYQENNPTTTFIFVGQKDSTDVKHKAKFIKNFAKFSSNMDILDLDERKLDWEHILEIAFQWAENQPLPVFFFFDEIQWICKKGSGFAGALKNCYDKHKSSNKLKIVICGSSIQFFKNNVEGPELTLMGLRNFAEIEVKPFTVTEVKDLFFPQWSNEEISLVYMFVGGIPYYLEQIDGTKAFRIAINETFFTKNSMFFKAVDEILNIDLNQAGVNKSKIILKNLKIEGTTENNLVSKTQLSQQLVNSYLEKLISFNIVGIKNNFKDNKKNHSGSIFYIKDFFLNFYFQVLEPNQEKILNNNSALIFPDIISSKKHYEIKDFSGIAFEYLVHHCLASEIHQYPKLFNKISIVDKEFELGVLMDLKNLNMQIDIVVSHKKDKNIRLIDCKWVSSTNGYSKFSEKILQQSKSFPKEKDQSISCFLCVSQIPSENAEKDMWKNNQTKIIVVDDLFK
jgi:AAA+ ATPase superfamily predicted ATPase